MNETSIAEVLAKVVPAQGMVLEVASGDGARALAFARAFPHLAWQPSERDPEAVGALARACEQAALSNLLRPLALDVSLQPWPVAQVDAVVCIDYTHMVAFDQVAALFGGGARALAAGGLFFLAGPFRFHGKYATKDAEELDQTLRARDPSLGLRDLRELTVAGTRSGLGLEHAVAIPGAHHALIFRRRPLLPPTGQFRVS